MSLRSPATYGKRQEYVVIAALLRLHFNVFMTLVDDQKIDCVIRQEKEDEIHYLDIQIRATEKECEPEEAGAFPALDISKPRENYYFIFYSELVNTFWVIPSLQLILKANQNKEGIFKGKYSINLCTFNQGGVIPDPEFREYENAFRLLERMKLPAPISKPLEAKPFIRPQKFGAEFHSPEEGSEMLTLKHEIAKLKGQTLETLAQHKKFTIVDVTEKNVVIRLEAIGLNVSISYQEEIYPACKLLYTHHEITLQDFQKTWAAYDTSFISAILAKLPGVRYTTKPVIKLFLD
jgi:hypothetical protein